MLQSVGGSRSDLSSHRTWDDIDVNFGVPSARCRVAFWVGSAAGVGGGSCGLSMFCSLHDREFAMDNWTHRSSNSDVVCVSVPCSLEGNGLSPKHCLSGIVAVRVGGGR